MATLFSNTLFPNSNSAPAIQAWAGYVESVLVTTGGWVVTGDTGQTPPASLTLPGAANTRVGYRVYRMADTLQATNPIFVRIDFGSGSSGAVGMWLTIGSGSDGAGNITGVGMGLTQVWSAPGLAVSGTFNCYGSASTNRFSLGMFINSVSNFAVQRILTLERSKDSGGNDTGDGVIMIWDDSAATGLLRYSLYVPIPAISFQPPLENGLNYVLTSQNPTQSLGTGNIGIGLVIPFKGQAQWPGYNVAIANSSDIAAEASFSMSVYGNTRTYQQVRMQPVALYVSDPAGKACIRYD